MPEVVVPQQGSVESIIASVGGSPAQGWPGGYPKFTLAKAKF